MRALASDLGLQRVSFPGPAYGAAKDALFRSADLFVLPTHSENFGIAIAEALAYGVPVITTTAAPWAGLRSTAAAGGSSCPRTVWPKPCGPPWTCRRSGARRWDAAAGCWMEQSYGWDRIAAQMKSVYRWLLGGAPPPSCIVTD